MRSLPLIHALLLWCCLQWRNARLYSVLFDIAPCYWKLLCKIPCAQNSWRYESIVLTNRIAGKRMKRKLKYKIMKCELWSMNCEVTTSLSSKSIHRETLTTKLVYRTFSATRQDWRNNLKWCWTAFIPKAKFCNNLSFYFLFLCF